MPLTILEANQRFGDKTDVVFQSHNWPHWDKENIKNYMENTVAVYQFIHDQTLHYVNLGHTAAEISNMIELPDELNKVWYTRQYYGTLSHNVKAVYQKYMGWYDANPEMVDIFGYYNYGVPSYHVPYADRGWRCGCPGDCGDILLC